MTTNEIEKRLDAFPREQEFTIYTFMRDMAKEDSPPTYARFSLTGNDLQEYVNLHRHLQGTTAQEVTVYLSYDKTHPASTDLDRLEIGRLADPDPKHLTIQIRSFFSGTDDPYESSVIPVLNVAMQMQQAHEAGVTELFAQDASGEPYEEDTQEFLALAKSQFAFFEAQRAKPRLKGNQS